MFPISSLDTMNFGLLENFNMSASSKVQNGNLLCLRTSPISVSAFLGGFETLSVPDFQRAFSWQDKQISCFLSDIERCRTARLTTKPKQHFFGAVVSCTESLSGTSRPHFIIVDGQQRIATLFILIVQLRKCLETSAINAVEDGNPDMASLFTARAKNIKSEFEYSEDIEFASPKRVRKLRLCKADDTFFGNIIDEIETEPTRSSHVKILSAYNLIGEYINETVLNRAHTPEDRWEELDALYRTFVQDWSIVHLSSDERAHANLMYRVLNARGVQASAGELLRARTLEYVSKPISGERLTEMASVWDEILSGDKIDPDIGLDLVYQSFKGSIPSSDSIDADIEGLFFPEISDDAKLTPDEADKIYSATQKLKNEIHKVGKITNGVAPFSQEDISAVDAARLKMIIVNLAQTDSAPLLLSAANLGCTKFLHIADLVERFSFRYSVVCGQSMSQAGPIFRTFARDIRLNPNRDISGDLRTALKDLLATRADDTIFKEQLRALKYKAVPNKVIKYLLITLEQFHRWSIDPARLGKPKCLNLTRVIDFSDTTIEHIEARNALVPTPELVPFVNNLGNLTILSEPENDDQGNRTFDDKKPLFRANGFGMNTEIADLDEWNLEAFETRTNQLLDRSLKVFNLDY